MNSANTMRTPAIPRVLNLRDLGGYLGAGDRRVRWGQLYRSGSTHLMTAADRETLAAHPIRTALDLRSRGERREYPHVLSSHAAVSYLAFEHDHVAGNILRMLADPKVKPGELRDLMLRLYADLPYRFAPTFRQLFAQAATGALPLMFNCTAGKDRTGVASAVLLSALGVQWPEVMQDYLLTAESVPRIVSVYGEFLHGQFPGHMTPEILAPVFGVERAYLESMRTAVESRSGSIEAYIRDTLEIDARALSVLHGRLLE